MSSGESKPRSFATLAAAMEAVAERAAERARQERQQRRQGPPAGRCFGSGGYPKSRLDLETSPVAFLRSPSGRVPGA